MNINCQIAIVGAGPVGLAEACLLKALNPTADICVLEKRSEENSGDPKSQGRSHGLAISFDSIAVLRRTLRRSASDNQTHKPWVQSLDKLFKKFKDKKFVSTKQIESELTLEAQKMGIKILRNTPVNSVEDIRRIKASILIAADGTHSKVRDLAIGAEKIHEKTYQYLAELKFKTEPNPFNDFKISSKVASNDQLISIGHQGSTPNENGLVEATELMVIGEKPHKYLLRKDKMGKITKGNHLNPWGHYDLFQVAQKNKKIHKIYKAFRRKLNGRKPIDYKVTTLPLSIYRSKNVVSVFDHKIVAAVGDASSGLVLYRGLNKGWIEAGYLADSVTTYLKRQPPEKNQQYRDVPAEFKVYECKSQQLFSREKLLVEFKNILITIAQIVLKILFAPLTWISSSFKDHRTTYSTNFVRRAFVPNMR